MKIRKATVCSACRSRKLGCDGKRPACSQCFLRGRQCPGYQANLIFRPPLVSHLPTAKRDDRQNSRTKRKKLKQHADTTEQRALTPGLAPTRAICWPLRDVISFCVQNFAPASELPLLSDDPKVSQSRICGSWIEVLPELVGRGESNLLPLAIRALGASIAARGCDGWAPISDALEANCSALTTLQGALSRTRVSPSDELAAAVMCLFLSEKLLPTSNASSVVHAKGISDLIQLCRPDFYASGVPHKLFVGFRPILILNAFDTRTSTFLATDEWKIEPFRLVPAVPLQALMNEAIEIPSILEKLDSSKLNPASAYLVAHEALFGFVEILDRLSRWYRSTQLSSRGPLWWPVSRTGGQTHLWFSSITVANCLTHLWAFWIICATQIRQLRAEFPGLMEQGIEVDGQVPESAHVSQKIIQESVRILQSVEFLTQDEMKLYGIASAALPLHTAWKVLDTINNSGTDTCSSSCQKVIERIISKGFGDVLMPRQYLEASRSVF
ncbi:N-terminal fungal transcription regulatory domain-containing protein [Dactylonectria macrodidyma]|uniref:N-terminal fungal transcription regulatory domain-containing protein n=1 Tax=Dactylonectria macrodidyma TaxID=307937 RepID=A0A9P9IEU1_9HYPO|nr:N-terminal fungal transcription regulatory domain-containing protein [Dactylonectria macrodidyma]